MNQKQKKCKIIHKWLKKNYPPPQPVVIKWVKHIPVEDHGVDYYTKIRGDYAICYRLKNKCIILLSDRALTTSLISETLIHEWVHALYKTPGHHSYFWLKYGRFMSGTLNKAATKKPTVSRKYVRVPCELIDSVGGEPHDPDERWTSYEPTYQTYKIGDYFYIDGEEKKHIDFQSVIVPDWEPGTKELYLIVVDYSDGDTFSTTYGLIDIPYACVSETLANRLKVFLEFPHQNHEKDLLLREYPVINDYYFRKYEGYFTNLTSVEIKKVCQKPVK